MPNRWEEETETFLGHGFTEFTEGSCDQDMRKLAALVAIKTLLVTGECLGFTPEHVSQVLEGAVTLDPAESEILDREIARVLASDLGTSLQQLLVQGEQKNEPIAPALDEAGEGADQEAVVPAAVVPAAVEPVAVEPVAVEPRVSPLEQRREQGRLSMWRARSLAISTQFRLESTDAEQLAAVELVAAVELYLIAYFGDTVPTPGMAWDEGRRERAMNLRLARLRWVRRRQEEEYTGLRGLWTALMGRRRITAMALYDRMVAEAGEAMDPEVRGLLNQDMAGRVEMDYTP